MACKPRAAAGGHSHLFSSLSCMFSYYSTGNIWTGGVAAVLAHTLSFPWIRLLVFLRLQQTGLLPMSSDDADAATWINASSGISESPHAVEHFQTLLWIRLLPGCSYTPSAS